MKTFALVLGVVILLSSGRLASAADPVIVHEWGTFTCLQDEHGNAIGGINVDDEPVPQFVYEIAGTSVVSQKADLGLPPHPPGPAVKGWISGDPSVTMRLETPVLYIYPPKGQSPGSVPPLDVSVQFHGGVLSQFYPFATASGLPMNGNTPYFQSKITNQTATGLDWKGVRLGSTQKPVITDDKVWTTPREVSAPLLEVHPMMKDVNGVVHDDAQVEHFLFYRGVGHVESPLRVVDQKENIEAELIGDGMGIMDYCWLVEIHPDGTCAFRYPKFLMSNSVKLPKTTSSFSGADFKPDNLAKLRASMHDALVKEGLYPNEATAMLKTWELSYFKSPGLRFFYIVPRAWTDKVLPLTITGAPTEITRVMVGRVELITDAQKAALARLSAGPCPDLAAVKQAALTALQNSNLPKDQGDAFYSGEKPLSDLGIPIPPLVQDYLSLGRFRDALIVHEHAQHSTAALAKFILENRLSQ